MKQLEYDLITEIEIDGIDFADAPDFCDAYISFAYYNGKPMTDEELDILNEDSQFVYECVQNKLY